MRGRRDGLPRVALLVDHPQRDLPGMVLTALELCRRGVVCHLVPLNLQERELLALAPDFVLINYLRLGNERVIRLLLSTGIRVGLLDTEGAIWSDCGAYTELLWQDPDLLRAVRPACMWGPRMADCLVDGGFLERSQIVVTGCPRFDLYHPQCESILRESSAAARRRILINTNFSGVNPRFATVDQNRRQFAESFGWSEERIARHLEAERQGIAGMIELARRLARDFPAVEVQIRPHPFENVKHYEAALRDVPGIRIGNEHPVQTDIFQAAVVVQRSCSTAIEAAMAGLPTVSPRWVATPVEIPIAEAVSLPCDSYATLRDAVDQALAGAGGQPPAVQHAREAVMRDYFHRLDGCSHARVADAVMRELGTGSSASVSACRRALYRLDNPDSTLIAEAGARVRRMLGLSPYWCFREGRSVPPAWWTTGAKAYSTADVSHFAKRVLLATGDRHGSSADMQVVSAQSAREYVCRFEGYSQVLAPSGAGPAIGRLASAAVA
jgi:surface carbohydrate biosynthesis protein